MLGTPSIFTFADHGWDGWVRQEQHLRFGRAIPANHFGITVPPIMPMTPDFTPHSEDPTHYGPAMQKLMEGASNRFKIFRRWGCIVRKYIY